MARGSWYTIHSIFNSDKSGGFLSCVSNSREGTVSLMLQDRKHFRSRDVTRWRAPVLACEKLWVSPQLCLNRTRWHTPVIPALERCRPEIRNSGTSLAAWQVQYRKEGQTEREKVETEGGGREIFSIQVLGRALLSFLSLELWTPGHSQDFGLLTTC